MTLITDQQALAMRELRTGQVTTAVVAQRLGISHDAARNCLTRMEARGWVASAGTGAAKKWTITQPGNSAWEQEGGVIAQRALAARRQAAASAPANGNGGVQRKLDTAGGQTVERDETDEERRAREEAEAKAETAVRTYVVLEELSLAAAIEQNVAAGQFDAGYLDPILDALQEVGVYIKVATPVSRNTEHAYRQAAKDVYAGGDVDEPVLVAVAAKMFQPTPVKITNRQTVSIG